MPLPLLHDCPKLSRFYAQTEDDVFCAETTAKVGVNFASTSGFEPLVLLRYFGPEVNPNAPTFGAYRKNTY